MRPHNDDTPPTAILDADSLRAAVEMLIAMAVIVLLAWAAVVAHDRVVPPAPVEQAR